MDDFQAGDADDGFRPLLSDDFKDTYGADSFFVRATADLFTAALADLVVGEERAREALATLLVATGAKKALLEEALGLAAPGALRQAVDAARGVGAFARWLRAFQSGDFAAASASLQP